jgi:hypothetical protein
MKLWFLDGRSAEFHTMTQLLFSCGLSTSYLATWGHQSKFGTYLECRPPRLALPTRWLAVQPQRSIIEMRSVTPLRRLSLSTPCSDVTSVPSVSCSHNAAYLFLIARCFLARVSMNSRELIKVWKKLPHPPTRELDVPICILWCTYTRYRSLCS